ncbi:hypothetical protein [uncultured Campylobacter sp.]|nr:hypothetical protein [uncultured Campylobacter sp.]
MKIIDIVITVLFVLFLCFLVIGFTKQMADRSEARKKSKIKEKERE